MHNPSEYLSDTDILRLSPAALAYLGDAIYELHVRQVLLFPPRRTRDFHNAVVERVCAPAQARVLASLMPELTVAEQTIVQRGRNGCGRSPRHIDPAIYRQASAFEALLGYLHLSDRSRLHAVLTRCDEVSRSLD